eukprot:scaffold19727_cov21-Tisochrysis_lutea.AAC.3
MQSPCTPSHFVVSIEHKLWHENGCEHEHGLRLKHDPRHEATGSRSRRLEHDPRYEATGSRSRWLEHAPMYEATGSRSRRLEHDPRYEATGSRSKRLEHDPRYEATGSRSRRLEHGQLLPLPLPVHTGYPRDQHGRRRSARAAAVTA